MTESESKVKKQKYIPTYEVQPATLTFLSGYCVFCKYMNNIDIGIKAVGLSYDRYFPAYGWTCCPDKDECLKKAQQHLEKLHKSVKYDFFMKHKEAKTPIKILRSSGIIEDNWILNSVIPSETNKLIIEVSCKEKAIIKGVILSEFLKLNPQFTEDLEEFLC
jgi:hypothetical protein